MRRWSALAAFALVFVVAAPGQGSAGTTAVQDALDKKDWQRAIDLLEPLARRANSLGERDRLAGLFAHAGTALCAERNWQLALRAWRGSLELLQKVTRKDHQGVASSHMWVGQCLTELDKAAEALPHFETACAMQRRLTDDAELIAKAFNNLGYCLANIGRHDDAMARYVEGLACIGPRAKEHDRPAVALLLHNVASLKQDRSDFLAAARLFADAIAMWQRLQCPADDPQLVRSRANYAHCLTRMAKTAEALPLFEAALAEARTRRGSGDDAEVAEMLNNIAWCRDSEGDPAAALALFEQSLAMRQRLAAGTDEPGVAQSLQNSAHCLQQLGRVAVALGRHEEALAMRQRLGGQNASLEVARSLDGVGDCLRRLGSPALAVERHAAALTMWTRIHGARDVVEVAFCRASIAGCLLELGEAEEARGVSEAALAMLRRIHADRDHPDVAKAMNTTASALAALGQLPPALAQHEAALAMQQRLFRGRAHPEIAATQLAIAACQSAAGEHAKALAGASAALATNEACFGDVDQVAAVRCLTWIGACLQALDRAPAAIVRLEAARDMLERLADRNRALSDDLRKSLLDELKRGGTYERLQALLVAAGKPADALAVAERSRSRLLLETLTQCGIDPLAEATARAEARGDRATTAALRGLRDELDAAWQEVDRLLHRLALQPVGADPGASAAVLADLRTQLTAATRKQQKALGRRARAVDGVLPAARPPSVAEIQRTLRPGELLLEYTVAPEASLLYVLAPDGDVQVFPLPGAAEAVDRLLPALVASLARASH
ncbi:MAG: tetratricopeptide repeat protein, partial [Planctomycetota bacterium]